MKKGLLIALLLTVASATSLTYANPENATANQGTNIPGVQNNAMLPPPPPGNDKLRHDIHSFIQSLSPQQRRAFANKMQTINTKWQSLSKQEQADYMLFMIDQKQKWVDMSPDQRATTISQLKQQLQQPANSPAPANPAAAPAAATPAVPDTKQ